MVYTGLGTVAERIDIEALCGVYTVNLTAVDGFNMKTIHRHV